MNRSSRLICFVILAATIGFQSMSVGAQDSAGPQPSSDISSNPDSVEPEVIAPIVPADLNLLNLLVQGGWFMIPLLMLSMLVVTMTMERLIGLRKAKVLPPILVRELADLGRAEGGFDPRAAYRICQTFPSAGSKVIQALLSKVGRPQSEVEHSVAEASQREAEKLHTNVRWLNMTAQIAPLIGLLGTVWGMIQAFYDTTQLDPGRNKSEALAEGIYTALVTTLVGLIVAIPAAIAAHYFESKIIRLFHQIDEMSFNLFPQIERFEGRVRFSQDRD